jgi:hypothetical protein
MRASVRTGQAMTYGEVERMANKEALERVLQHITDSPDQWNQERWITCFAGWTVRLIKGAVLSADGCCGLCSTLKIDGQEARPYEVPELAQEALELTDEQASALFCANNELDDLTRLVGEFTAEKVSA